MMSATGYEAENDPGLLLLDDRYAPVTSDIGFIEAGCDVVVREYLAWQRSIGATSGVVALTERRVQGALEDALSALLPLVDGSARRCLFVPTRGRWTAYFDNGWTGPDVFPPVSYLAGRLRCRGVRAAASRHVAPDDRGRGQYGAVILDMWGPEGEPPLMYVRSVHAMNDGGRWEFDEYGERLPFEETERYAQRRIRDRFTFAMLGRYLEALGIRAFESGFYMPDGEAILVERASRPEIANAQREYTLEEVRTLRRLSPSRPNATS